LAISALSTPVEWSAAAAVIGVGMALLYPTLMAAMGDIAPRNWRGSALGVYRFWRDLGYAIGALGMGFLADASGLFEAGFWFTGLAMACSAILLAIAMEETLPRLNPAAEISENPATVAQDKVPVTVCGRGAGRSAATCR
jgi:MFS family permease